MTIKTNNKHSDLEASGEDELTLAAVRYTGDQSVYNANATRQQGGWPALSAFNPGVWEVALLPSKDLGFWERHADFEIGYDKETLAEALLSKNYLAPEVFGANVNVALRDRVLDTLGIDVHRNAEAYREALAEVAGEDVEPGQEADPHETRAADFADVKRSTLQRAAEAHGMDGVESAQSQAMIEYLTEQDDDDVDATIRSIQDGEGVPETAENSDESSDIESFEDIDGVAESRADDLREAEFGDLDDLRAASVEDLATVDGVSESLAADIKDQLGAEEG